MDSETVARTINNKICTDASKHESHYRLCFHKNDENPNIRRMYFVTNLLMLSRAQLTNKQLYEFIDTFEIASQNKILAAADNSKTKSNKPFQESSERDRFYLILRLLQLFDMEITEKQVTTLISMLDQEQLNNIMNIL